MMASTEPWYGIHHVLGLPQREAPSSAWTPVYQAVSPAILQMAEQDIGELLMEWLYKHILISASDRSKEYLDRKQYRRAIEICDQAIARSARTRTFGAFLAVIYNNRGVAFFHLKQYSEAFRDYERALELHPSYFLTHRNRIHLLLACKEEQRALQETETLVALLPQEAEKQDARGHTLFHLKRYQPALQHFQAALALNPNKAERHYWVGMMLFYSKNYSQALHSLLQALNLDAKNPAYHAATGLIYLRMQDFFQALRHLTQSLTLNPQNSHARHNFACILLHLNRVNEGRDQLRRALELEPEHLCTIWTIECCNLCFDLFDPAIIARFERAAEAEVDHSEHLKDLCRCLACWLQQRYDMALACTELALAKEPESEDAHFWKGMTLAAMGRDEEARIALEWARENGVPPCLFHTLKLLKPHNEAFYQQYALPLLEQNL